jgi:hypothetical protein
MMDINSFDKALDYLKEAEKLDELNHEIYEKKGICYFSKVILFQIFLKYILLLFLYLLFIYFRKNMISRKRNSKKHLVKKIVI